MLKIEKIEPNTIVLIGRIDSSSLDDLKTELESANGDIVLDMAAVDYINSAGLGLILWAKKQLNEKGNDIQIHQVTEFVREIFVISGLDNLISLSE